MLKQAVKYNDFDDNEQIEVLYFNLTKSELADNLDLKEEFEGIQRDFTGEDRIRDLTEAEIRRVLELVKKIMRLSYGTRSADGKRFIKTEQQWVEFTQTAAYDQFLMSLFTDANASVAFITQILPKDLREAALEASNHVNGLSATRTAEVIAAQKEQSDRAAEAAAQKASGEGFAKVVEEAPEGTSLKENIVTHLSNVNEAAGGVGREAAGKPVLSDPPTQSELTSMMEWLNNN